jgi:23S rRNA pseudouridine1911/1915/1917 synthase
MKAQQVELTLNEPGERLDKALTGAMPDLSRMQWQRLIKEGRVLVNGQTSRPSHRLSGGEQIFADIPEAVESELVPEEIPLDIRYEDSDIIVVNKPAGMVVHPGTGHDSGTLVNALLGHCTDLAGIGNTKRPGIVHRLDKHTSGLLVVAKNDQAQHYLQAQFKKRTVGKKYLALVHGQIQPTAALIDAPIGRDPNQRKKMSVIAPGGPRATSARSRSAQTAYHALTFYQDHTLVECSLYTGRTHQIRVHLAYIGYPIVGDSVYGRRKQPLPLKRHFLHAAELTIRRPSDQEEVTFNAELPPELQTILDNLES